MPEYRAVFDASITFRNGGGLQTQGFRLDIPHGDATAAEIGALLVRHLGLLMVERVDLTKLRVIEEPHKGSRGVEADRPRESRLVELNHVITAGMTTYPGLPGPEITPHLTREASRGSYAPGTEFAIDRISMVGNTGTYLDSPYHRYADGIDLAGLALAKVADLPIALVRLTGSTRREIDAAALQSLDVRGRAVLLHTGWDAHWGRPAYGLPAPFLNAEGAHWLADNKAALVGIDSVNIDDAADQSRPAHSLLLAAGIPVLEHLTGLGELPATGARLHAAPPRLESFGTFTVRAYAVVR
jgi:kynurenine formamidase